MNSHIKFLFSFILIVLSCAVSAEQDDVLFPCFQYSDQDLNAIADLQSDLSIKKGDLKKWDQNVDEEFKETPGSFSKLRLLTYLYVAQNDAAALSLKVKGKLAGNLDALSYAVISLFLPDYKKPTDFKEDGYSNALKEIVLKKIRERVKKEDARQVRFHPPEKFKADFSIGLDTAKWNPWYALPTSAFLAPPPPTDKKVWDQQLKEIRESQDPMTEEKKHQIHLWAAMEKPEKSDWVAIANSYLFSKDIPLQKIIQVRFVLMVGLYDAFIVSFESKYKYLAIRPSMRDPTVHTEIAVPKHPSYPSNHSLTGALSATILSYFFPSESPDWNRLADEGGLSRIWAGIHYPIDDQVGRQVGKKIADNLLEHLFKQK